MVQNKNYLNQNLYRYFVFRAIERHQLTFFVFNAFYTNNITILINIYDVFERALW